MLELRRRKKTRPTCQLRRSLHPLRWRTPCHCDRPGTEFRTPCSATSYRLRLACSFHLLWINAVHHQSPYKHLISNHSFVWPLYWWYCTFLLSFSLHSCGSPVCVLWFFVTFRTAETRKQLHFWWFWNGKFLNSQNGKKQSNCATSISPDYR